MKCHWLVKGVVIAGLVTVAANSSTVNADSLDITQEDSGLVKNAGHENHDNNLKGFEIIKPLPELVPFGVGERFVFALQYGLVYAGDATLEIRNIAVLDSIESYHIFSLARTNKAFDMVFKVRDHHESFMDYENLYSLRFEKHLREGKFRRDEIIDFDQKKHLAVYKDTKIKIPPNTHDFLTAFYYMRTISLIPGQAIFLANHSGKKNYPIYVKVLRKEKVSVPAGDFECVVIEPVLKTSSIFKHQGKLTIWLTDDIAKMPVLLRSKVLVGSFEARLKEYKMSEEKPRVPGIGKKAINVK